MNDRSHNYVIYIVVRESLGMSNGKIISQACHAIHDIVEDYFDYQSKSCVNCEYKGCEKCEERRKNTHTYREWTKEPTKVVLRADELTWEKLKQLSNSYVVIDGGYTEVPPNSETVLGFWPMKKSEAPELIKSLKLL